jgi:hypothetical protein
MNNVTNPQPFGSPLNLTYKGVFSTRLSMNKNSQYGHYLDKLYQVQFLGIGTHAATEFHDLMNAVILRKTSIDGRVEMYKATPDKYSESVILETLGGTRELKETEDRTVTLADRLIISPSTVHDLLRIGYDVVTYGDLTDFYTAEQLRAADVLINLIADSVARETELDIKLAARRLNKLKMAESDVALISALRINAQALLETTEEMSKTLMGLIHEANMNDTLTRLFKQADELEVKVALSNSKGSKGLLDRIETLRKHMPKALDNKGLEIYSKSALEASEIEELLLNSKNLSGVILLGNEEARVTTEPIGDVIHSVEYKFKARVAETLTNVLASELPVGSNAVIISDMDSLSVLVRKAGVIAESAYLAEKLGKESLVEVLTTLGSLNSRQAAIAHYIMYQDSADYRQAIESSIASYIDSTSTNLQAVVETIQSLSRDILKDAKQDRDYFVARSVIEEAEVAYTGGLKFSTMVRQAGESVEQKLRGATRATNLAEIEYAHNVMGEDSKVYTAALDALYQDFLSMAKSGGTTVEPIIVSGMTINKDALVVEHLIGEKHVHNKGEVYNDYYADKSIKSNTELNTDSFYAVKTTKSTTGAKSEELSANRVIVYPSLVNEQLSANRLIVNKASVMEGQDQHGAMWSDTPVYVENRDVELFGELTNEQQTLSYSNESPVFGELTSEPKQLVPDLSVELWGELTSTDSPVVYSPKWELTGELSSEPTRLRNELFVEIIAEKMPTREGFSVTDYAIAVLGCENPNLKYRRRPDLEPDKEPEDPLFEWICTEGFVCDDWLIVPLKDFNFENPEQGTFYDPATFEPYFPTGQTDEEGDPYVLPPYSILNEPLSNGADVGGKLPMSIDPCNLYSFINYTVKIYDTHKSRFHASTPTDTISRVLNMLYEQVEKLVGEWDDTKEYTPDELWRIYRFIRWMALGITNRFYRVKIDYTYGDFVENFEVYPFSNMVTTEGSARKLVEGNTFVMEGHPVVNAIQNKAKFDFKLPQKTHSSTISFEIANVVPDRPDDILQGGVLFLEDFQGLEDDYKLNGNGWVTATTQGGNSLAIEEPAQARTYRTNTFNIQSNAVNPHLTFNYGIDTNMDTRIMLKKVNGETVWESQGIASYGAGNLSTISEGDYYFEIKVPQDVTNSLSDLSFTATQIQNEWQKVGYITEWQVIGDTIFENQNTPGIAMVINPQWVLEGEYELECEFFTKDVPANYGLIDWLGVVLNYKDASNYYLFGTWSSLDRYAKGGLHKVVNGQSVGTMASPKWLLNSDFRFVLDRWHKLKAVVKGNQFTVYIDGTKYLEITDSEGWGYGASGLAAYSNPLSSFRNFKYKGKPRFSAFIDNVKVESTTITTPVEKPKYGIDFFLDGESPRIADYSAETKRAYSFPILVGEHKASWVFKKVGSARSLPQDASFVDNIVVKGMKVVSAKVVEEFIGCGGHLAVKLLIENLLEYYRRHHQGCKGERNIWIIE